MPETPQAGPSHQDALPPGTRLGEFELQRQLGEGGFSIVYLAWDHSLQRRVALKEYMPLSLASRVARGGVQARSERMRETFEVGLRSFINEARALAQFDHPALVKVHRFWEAQGTAYMVMPFYEGRTLKQAVRSMAAPPDERWLLGLLAPLTEALAVLHAANWYHRDIAPDNIILLGESGQPLLLDFGAARRVIGESTQDLTAILKPGYAPLEQYAESPGLKQGAWTDVYALAATVYWAISGRTPPPAVGRVIDDAYAPLARTAAGRYGDAFLQAVDRALAVMPGGRTHSIDEFRRDIGLLRGAASQAPPAPAAPAAPPTPPTPPTPLVAASENATTLLFAPAPAPPRRRVWLMAAVAVLLAAAGIVAWRNGGAPADRTSEVGTAASAALPGAAAASRVEPVAVTLPPVAAVPAPTPAPMAGDEAAPGPVRSRAAPPARPAEAAVSRREARASVPASGHDRECAALLQRLSLGEDSRELADRIAALGCR